MAETETDAAFLKRMNDTQRVSGGHDMNRLLRLARRGAEADEQIADLEETIRVMRCCPDMKCDGSCQTALNAGDTTDDKS